MTTTREPDGAVSQPPRIAPIEQADDDQRDALGKTLHGRDGLPLNVFKTLAHRPKLLRRVNSLAGYFAVHGSIPVREREIVILRTAARAHSAYELAHHRRFAAEAGLTPEEIDAAIDPRSTYNWSPRRSRAASARRRAVRRAGHRSDETWDVARRPLGRRGRLELLVLVGLYRMLAGVLNAVRVEADA